MTAKEKFHEDVRKYGAIKQNELAGNVWVANDNGCVDIFSIPDLNYYDRFVVEFDGLLESASMMKCIGKCAVFEENSVVKEIAMKVLDDEDLNDAEIGELVIYLWDKGYLDLDVDKDFYFHEQYEDAIEDVVGNSLELNSVQKKLVTNLSDLLDLCTKDGVGFGFSDGELFAFNAKEYDIEFVNDDDVDLSRIVHGGLDILEQHKVSVPLVFTDVYDSRDFELTKIN